MMLNTMTVTIEMDREAFNVEFDLRYDGGNDDYLPNIGLPDFVRMISPESGEHVGDLPWSAFFLYIRAEGWTTDGLLEYLAETAYEEVQLGIEAYAEQMAD